MQKITLGQYQEVALSTCAELPMQQQILHATLGLVSESGEIADNVKRKIAYGRDLDIPNLIEEAGDVLWYLLLLTKTLGLSLEDIADANIAKLSRRYPELRFTAERALNRDTAAEMDAIGESLA